MDELIKDYNNYVCFTFYEKEKKCEITIYNEKEILCQKLVLKEEGEKKLLTFCLNWRYLEILPHIDTIGLRNRDDINGFVRYEESPGVIKDFKYNLIPRFICDFLGNLKKEQDENISISFGEERYHIPIIEIYGEKFFMTFKVDNKMYYPPYIIENYINEHENISVQEVKGNNKQIILDGINFPTELLNQEQREYFMSKIRENNNASFTQFLGSPIGERLIQSLEGQDSMQRVRIKSDMPE